MAMQNWNYDQANIVQWRAAQKSKLTSIEKQMQEMEVRLRSHRVFLADRTMVLYGESRIADPDLLSICRSIADLQSALDGLKAEHEAVSNEQPPEPEIRELPTLGLKCPIDGQPLKARFCPEHGVEGIPLEVSAPHSNPGGQEAQRRKCPACGQILSARYCPDHGVEGVPAE